MNKWAKVYIVYAIVMLVIATITYPNPLCGMLAAMSIYYADEEYRRPKKVEAE